MAGVQAFRSPPATAQYNYITQPYPNGSAQINNIFANGRYIFTIASGGSNGFARWAIDQNEVPLPAVQMAGAGRPILQLPLSGNSTGCAATGNRIVCADNAGDIFTSDDDGVSWQLRDAAGTTGYYQIVLGPANTLIAFSSSSGNASRISIDNGDTWSLVGHAFPVGGTLGYKNVVYAPEVGIWFKGNSGNGYSYSFNGTVWNNVTIGASFQPGAAIYFNGSFYIHSNALLGGVDQIMARIPAAGLGVTPPIALDGFYGNWSSTTSGPQGRVFYIFEGRLFVAGQSGFIAYLDLDGNWKSATSDSSNSIQDAVVVNQDIWLAQGTRVARSIAQGV